ncbi:CRP-like cAMP-binding protein [Algoriphagus sp. 4150]|uniref:Crp/Fnr family transcriptional regulator n=1 Tax=Algoriphagus sp. 4150 TaxID=2817756 RepID=UPI00285B1B72|nr:Crp/Fnr family transcriptional regulator [Algoriphagus sp. 4150]MDR7127965.1 CRP-like cAMP-binding protein [Algoriphagus sp. 4150]
MEKLRKHIEEITPISDKEFDAVKPFFTIRRVLKNQYLIQQGDDAKYEYLILTGIFRVFYLDDQGKEHIIQFATENWWMSDYIAYFNQKKANMYVLCMEPGEVLCLTLEGRENLSMLLPKMEHFFRIKLTNGYMALQQRIISLLSSNPQQRYEEFANQYPNLMLKIPKKYIAEYLGVSRETLSRLYAKD